MLKGNRWRLCCRMGRLQKRYFRAKKLTYCRNSTPFTCLYTLFEFASVHWYYYPSLQWQRTISNADCLRSKKK